MEISLSGLEITLRLRQRGHCRPTGSGFNTLRHVVNLWRGAGPGWSFSDPDLGGETVTGTRYYFKNGSLTDYTAEIAIPTAQIPA